MFYATISVSPIIFSIIAVILIAFNLGAQHKRRERRNLLIFAVLFNVLSIVAFIALKLFVLEIR